MTSVVKLGVLQNNLTAVKGESVENETLNTSIAQVTALIESLRSGLEQNLNWVIYKSLF